MNKTQKFIVLWLSVLVFGVMLYAGNNGNAGNRDTKVRVTVFVKNSDAAVVTATSIDRGFKAVFAAGVEGRKKKRYAVVNVARGHSYIFSDGCGSSTGEIYIKCACPVGL